MFGALVLPSESQQRVGDLLSDFRAHGRLALIPLAAYQLLWIPTNYRGGLISWLSGIWLTSCWAS